MHFYRYAPTQDDTLKPYKIYGATIAEVEIDLLTGQHIIRRVDLMEDVGISLNPEIDIGQVEGAFVMGIGYWTSEELIYDSKTGVLTNDRTWVHYFEFLTNNSIGQLLRLIDIIIIY